MSRHKKDPLRELTEPERQELIQLSRSRSSPAAEVIRAKLLLAVAAGDDAGPVVVADPDAESKKKLIEAADLAGEAMGLAVWCTDQAGPYPTIPYAGRSWRPEGEPERQPHEYLRDGTAKALTLFHPADGHARVKGVTACPNAVLHPWLKEELGRVLAAMPDPPGEPATGWRTARERWQEGLTIRPTLPEEPPPRMLLVLDNLAGHKTPELVCWLFDHGIMPLYTPVRGSWLNMAESLQRIVRRRALDGRYPIDTARVIAWYEAAARHRDAAPTPFVWGGKRAARRRRQRERRHRLGGSGACSRGPVPRHSALWPHASQVTH